MQMNLIICIKLILSMPEKAVLLPLERRIFDYLQESNLSAIEIHSELGNKIENNKSVFTGKKGGLFVQHQNLYKKLHELRNLKLIEEVNGKYRLTDLGWCFLIQKDIISLEKFYKNSNAVGQYPFFVELFLEPLFSESTLSELTNNDVAQNEIKNYLRSCIYNIKYSYELSEHVDRTRGIKEAVNILNTLIQGTIQKSIHDLIATLASFSALPETENQKLAQILHQDDNFKEALKSYDKSYQIGKNRILNGS